MADSEETDDGSGIREALFGSRLRIAVVAVVVLGLVVVALVATGVLGAPTVTGVENRFAGVNDTTTVIDSDLSVRNPNPVGVTLGGLTIDYEVRMNDVQMAAGTKDGVSVATGESVVPFTTAMDNDRIPVWWTSHVRNDERTALAISADVHSSTLGRSFDAPAVTREVETDMLSAFNSTETRPVNADRPLVSDPVFYINETSAWWGAANDSTTEMRMAFVVYNPKSYPLVVSRIGYNVSMNEVRVGEGATDREVVIPPGETETIRARTLVRNDRLDDWWVTHLERNQRTTLDVAFVAVVDLEATSVRVPLTPYEETFETDIFGTKPDDGNATSGGGDDGTATAVPDAMTATPVDTDGVLDGGTATATPTGTAAPAETPETTPTPTATETPTSTATPTPSPTPTEDDGGILAVDAENAD